MEKNLKALRRSLVRMAVLAMLCLIVVLPAHAADWEGAMKALQTGMAKEQAEIDISAYGIPADGFWDRYNTWRDQGKFPWYVDGGGNGWQQGNIMTKVLPSYLDRTEFNRQVYEQRVQQILSETVHEGMSAWQIALSIHDYLPTICEYDQRWYTDQPNANHEGYDCIVNGLAVCDGYSRAYMDLMNRAGVPCIVIFSNGEGSMNHAWNLVQIGGSWYHVDVTWDDPSFNHMDVEGYVGHKYFLLSDATISDSEHEHYGWKSPYTCTATDFEYATNPFWNDVTSQIIWLDDSVCFWRDGDNQSFQIKRRDANTGISTVLYEMGLPTVNIGSGSYYYWSYGLSYYNGLLYFSDTTHVYSLPLTGGPATVVYTYPATTYGQIIEGCFADNAAMDLTLCTHDGTRTFYRVGLNTSGHNHSYSITDVLPTCQDEGYTLFACSCGSQFTSGQLDPVSTNHSYVQTERVDPTVLEAGYVVRVCEHCGDTQTQQLPKLSNPFTDVPKGAYYEESVMWAVSCGITAGTSATRFSPGNNCTRGQVVSFLWRYAGSPEPRTAYNPFRDVKSSDYFYKAVLWAVENGITSGTSANTFSPNSSCTRAQVACFLQRAEGSPDPVMYANPFSDVAYGKYYEEAVMWAVENGITSGVGAGRFAPDAACTRAQIVTFLRRASQIGDAPGVGNISGYDPYTAAACSIQAALEYAPEGTTVYLVEMQHTAGTSAGYPLVEGWYYWQDAAGNQTPFWCLSVINETDGFANADSSIRVNETYCVSTIIYDADPVRNPGAYGYSPLDVQTCIDTYNSMDFS